MKQFKGKAIYNPSGKAGEYSYWVCNFYVGCSNNCSYCYLKKGIGAKTLGGCIPTLKKCFKDKKDAIDVFVNEMFINHDELRKHGLFFSFTTDPAIKETFSLTASAIGVCMRSRIPVKILTKSKITDFTMFNWVHLDYHDRYKDLIAIGNTLTGHDELEPNASTNKERIEGMMELHKAGFKTFASIEPIIDFSSSLKMIKQTIGYCDLYKIGLESGKKYNHNEMGLFVHKVIQLVEKSGAKIYFKDSITKFIPNIKNACVVGRDYNIFN